MKNRIIKLSYVVSVLIIIFSVLTYENGIHLTNLLTAIIPSAYCIFVIIANKGRHSIV